MTAGASRPAHRRAAIDAAQRAFIVFGGGAELPWLRPLRRGFRHCFAALEDANGCWTVLDPLSGRLVVARLDLPQGVDLPGFYRRAGLTVLGPFLPGGPRRSLMPPFAPFSCVSLCRAVLGSGAPFAMTPFGLFRALVRREYHRKIFLTKGTPLAWNCPRQRANCARCPIPSRPAERARLLHRRAGPAAFRRGLPPKREVKRMGGLFSAPKPKIVAAPEPAPGAAPAVAAAPEAAAQAAGEESRAENRARAARGIAGTVATSSRGVLEQLPGLSRKSLLGQ